MGFPEFITEMTVPNVKAGGRRWWRFVTMWSRLDWRRAVADGHSWLDLLRNDTAVDELTRSFGFRRLRVRWCSRPGFRFVEVIAGRVVRCCLCYHDREKLAQSPAFRRATMLQRRYDAEFRRATDRETAVVDTTGLEKPLERPWRDLGGLQER